MRILYQTNKQTGITYVYENKACLDKEKIIKGKKELYQAIGVPVP